MTRMSRWRAPWSPSCGTSTASLGLSSPFSGSRRRGFSTGDSWSVFYKDPSVSVHKNLVSQSAENDETYLLICKEKSLCATIIFPNLLAWNLDPFLTNSTFFSSEGREQFWLDEHHTNPQRWPRYDKCLRFLIVKIFFTSLWTWWPCHDMPWRCFR